MLRYPVFAQRRRWLVAALSAGAMVLPTAALAQPDDTLLRELRAGAVLLMRHTQTVPGVGDPSGWRLGDCKSQRNLDASGIEQARRIGRWFAEQQLRPQVVRHSPWCRTRDTATLAFDRSDEWAALSNIFEDRAPADALAAEVRRYIAGVPPGQLVVLVSHGVTIGHIVPAAAGLAQGEAAVVRAGATAGEPPLLIGRLRLP